MAPTGKEPLIMGIDPGVSGGIAVLTASGRIHSVAKMPVTLHDIWFEIGEPEGVVYAVIEDVLLRPVKGRNIGMKGAKTFMKNVGALEMALVVAAVPFDRVLPQTWQAKMGCRTGGDKNVSKAAAQRLFPHAKMTHAIADALLLAEYARRLAVARYPA